MGALRELSFSYLAQVNGDDNMGHTDRLPLSLEVPSTHLWTKPPNDWVSHPPKWYSCGSKPKALLLLREYPCFHSWLHALMLEWHEELAQASSTSRNTLLLETFVSPLYCGIRLPSYSPYLLISWFNSWRSRGNWCCRRTGPSVETLLHKLCPTPATGLVPGYYYLLPFSFGLLSGFLPSYEGTICWGTPLMYYLLMILLDFCFLGSRRLHVQFMWIEWTALRHSLCIRKLNPLKATRSNWYGIVVRLVPLCFSVSADLMEFDNTFDNSLQDFFLATRQPGKNEQWNSIRRSFRLICLRTKRQKL